MRLNPEEANIKLHLVFDTKGFKDIFQIKLKVSRSNRVQKQSKMYAGYVTLDPVKFEQDTESANKVFIYR